MSDNTAKTQITAEPGVMQILISREFDAPAALVYRAHTDPELLARWMGPRRLAMRVDEFDVRDGGKWRFVHVDTDGSEYGFHGYFHGEPSVDGITWTWEFEGAPGHVSLETVTFEERDGKTTVHCNAVYQSVDARDMHIASGMESGVNEGFERLDELLAELAPVA